MKQILLTYGLSKKTVASIMVLFKNTEAKLRSSNGDIDLFDIVDERNISTIYVYHLPRLPNSNVNRSDKKRFHIKKKQEGDDILQKL